MTISATTTTTTAGDRAGRPIGPLDPATYRGTPHLLADLPIGLVTASTTLLAAPGAG